MHMDEKVMPLYGYKIDIFSDGRKLPMYLEVNYVKTIIILMTFRWFFSFLDSSKFAIKTVSTLFILSLLIWMQHCVYTSMLARQFLNEHWKFFNTTSTELRCAIRIFNWWVPNFFELTWKDPFLWPFQCIQGVKKLDSLHLKCYPNEIL